jgi:hypothetical protein
MGSNHVRREPFKPGQTGNKMSKASLAALRPGDCSAPRDVQTKIYLIAAFNKWIAVLRRDRRRQSNCKFRKLH